jgi:hypothetical protein
MILIALTLGLIGVLDPAPIVRSVRLQPDDVRGGRLQPALQADHDRQGPPERPRATVAVPPIKITGRTIRVAAGESLQNAIDEAKGGDLIALEPGATYQGPFQLRRKDGDGWVVISSAAKDLPQPGQRISPSDRSKLAKLTSSSGTIVRADPGAHHYRLVGLEIAPADGEYLNTLIELGDDARGVEALPHHLIVERSYIHGDPARGARRGIAMNARHMAVVDSWFADFKERGADTQAIAGWNGDGPFRIANNYLEASGENIMFGGADPAIPGLVPADIEIVRNHFAKPLRWKSGHPSFEGTEWTVKNLLELKNARRVVIDGNLFEHNWPQAQNGFAILFTVRNQDGRAPWSTIEDVVFSNNLVRHVAAGVNILGRDDNHPSGQARRIAIRNNVFLDVGGQWGNGRLFQLLNGTSGVTIERNTALQTGNILSGGDSAPHTHFVFQGNIAPHNENGINGSGTAPGADTLAKYFPGAVVRGNVIVDGPAARYPKDNFFPGTLDDVAPDFARKLHTRTRPAWREAGADVAAVEKALGGIAKVEVGATHAPPDAQ